MPSCCVFSIISLILPMLVGHRGIPAGVSLLCERRAYGTETGFKQSVWTGA